jgi:hypothetical protein
MAAARRMLPLIYFWLLSSVEALRQPPSHATVTTLSRRGMLVFTGLAPLSISAFDELPSPTGLAYTDDVGTKSYSQVQRAWERSSQMTQRESFMAMRGVDITIDVATDALTERAKKRRAMAGCKDAYFRGRAHYPTEASCNRDVMEGTLSPILDAMSAD